MLGYSKTRMSGIASIWDQLTKAATTFLQPPDSGHIPGDILSFHNKVFANLVIRSKIQEGTESIWLFRND